MLLRELINQTVVKKDEIKQRRTICQMGLLNAKEDLREAAERHKEAFNRVNDSDVVYARVIVRPLF